MSITPDDTLLFSIGFFPVNATIGFTWLVMAILTLGSWLITRRLSSETEISHWQNLLEVLVSGIRDQIKALAGNAADRYLAFIGTLFIFVVSSNLLAVVPGYRPPTASLSTTTALAICVFIAVPLYGVANEGVGAYLHHYVKPTFLMLPFNLIGEFSRIIALAVRLYGNIMSGTLIVGILISLMPLFFPVLIQLLGLITGVIQAYIFAVLAMVYIASASSVHYRSTNPDTGNIPESDMR